MVGVVLLYARTELFEPAAFADRAVAALDDGDVRRAIAPTVVSAIQSVSPATAPSTAEVADLLANPRVSDAFGDAAAVATRQLFGRGSGELDLDLAEVSAIAIAVSEDTTVAELGIPPAALDSVRLDLIGGRVVLDSLDAAERISSLGFVLVPLGLLALILSIPLASGPLRGVSMAALSLAVVAALTLALLYVGREMTASQFNDDLTRDARRRRLGLGARRTADRPVGRRSRRWPDRARQRRRGVVARARPVTGMVPPGSLTIGVR